MPEMSSGRLSQTLDAASDEPLPSALARGTSVSRYLLLERLGAGAMGVVWAAYDPELDRRIALKLLRPRAAGGSEGQARLVREAQAMAKLSHPHVIAIHDVGQHAGHVFLAMEFVEGDTLTSWRTRTRTWSDIVGVYLQAGRGLAAAHQAGLVHRDFKPDNVLIGRDGRVRVTDFGLARNVGAGEAAAQRSESAPQAGLAARSDTRTPDPSSTTITQTGALVGTPAYMAPEQFVGGRIDARSDQFSFCVALWEALYGQRPFAGRTLAQLSEAVVGGAILGPPSEVRVPSFVERALRRGLAPEPDARWPDMDALLHALGRDVVGIRRRRIGVGLGLVGALALVLPLLLDSSDAPSGPTCSDAHERLAGVWDAQIETELEPLIVAAREGRTLWPNLVASCGDRSYLDSPLPIPSEPHAATRVREIRQEVAELRTRIEIADFEGRLTAFDRLQADAKLLGFEPIEVELQAERAIAEALLGTPDQPGLRERLEQALTAAVRSGRDDLAARVGLELIYVVGTGHRDVDAGLRWADLVDAWQARSGADVFARVMARITRGHVLAYGDRPREAEQVFAGALDVLGVDPQFISDRVTTAAALEQFEGLAPRERLALAYVLHGLSRVALADADFPRARRLLEREHTLIRGYFPRDHEVVAFTEGNLSTVLFVLGDWGGALAMLDELADDPQLAGAGSQHTSWLRGLVLLADVHLMIAELRSEGPERARSIANADELLARVGDEVEQLDSLARARFWIGRARLARFAGELERGEQLLDAFERRELERVGTLTPTARATLELERVRLAFARERPADALARIESLASLLDAPPLTGHPLRAAALGYRSQALHALGRQGAAAPLDEALALLDTLCPTGHPLSIRLLELAAQLHPERAEALRARAGALRDGLPSPKRRDFVH